MKNKSLLILFGLAILVASCKKETESAESAPDQVVLKIEGDIAKAPENAMTKTEINQIAERLLIEEGVVRWEKMSDEALWSAVVQTDSLVSIGYQPEGYQNLNDQIHLIDVKSEKWNGVYRALVEFIVDETNALHPEKPVEAEDIIAFGEKPLPYFNVQIADYSTIAKLRRMNVVRYVEPMGYGTETTTPNRSAAGCGDNTPNYGLQNGVDYTVISPNAKVSWNYDSSNIQDAWNESTGSGITIGLIDTGVSQDQYALNGGFSNSTGRSITKKGFHESCWWWWCSNDGVWDDCGHGTSMAGTIAAPRANNGNSVGVAYNANLISCRGTDDVIINGSKEKDGVSDSYYYLGNRNDVRIISMSLGDVFWSGQVADAVRYANNRGKLIFCAAGTSLSWTSWWGVIFPANMSETTAVTGIKTGSPMARCAECHSGSQVDFVIVMQDRNNTNRGPITLSDYSNQPNYTGGSSVATATTAGIAALVWAENPSLNKNQVKDILKQNSSNYPGRSSQYGWGIVDAAGAVADAN